MALNTSDWHVFLSFRGADTRYGFTDHLHNALDRNGIRTFMDDPELHSGEIISSALLNAIRNSKTYIVVLSQNYASSTWCLDELVEIIECFREFGRLVIPIFYKIHPSVVRTQTGSIETAFYKHQLRFPGEMEKLDKWRNTLHEVANFSGQHIDGTRSEVDTINEVVHAILRETNPVNLNVAKYQVGIDAPVAKITEWLTNRTSRGHYIGIYGMGGIGKTTLARAVFNANLGNFQGSCFLEKVAEVSDQLKGLEGLQAHLIANVLKNNKTEIDNVAQGMELIRERICSKKVLIALDDVNDQKQLDSLVVGPFAPGSVIILTTRHKDLLDRVGVEAKYQFMLNELGDAHSQQLFNKHAFGGDNPSDTCVMLSKEILHHAGGLPLALEIFGSNLCNQPEAEWRRFIGELKEVVNPKINDILVISFKSLVAPTLKEMFLDIACFSVGHYRKNVVPILGSCYKDVDANIDRLKSRCLIKIDNNSKFSMHDLVRDMGWEITRQHSGKDELRKHSRVSGREDIRNVLDDINDSEGTGAIKCMVHHCDYLGSGGVTFDTETFKRVPKLRFLKINYVNISGSFEQIFKDLTWLHWYCCPLKSLDSDFYPKKLVILQLPCSKITRWKLTKDLTNLKILDLSCSDELITTPDFCRLSCLETINLSSCTKLEKVDTTIGDLKNLVSLDLSDCTSLSRLPDSVCKLTALESLDIGDCLSLEALPGELGNMKSLTRLVVSSPRITKLPDSSRHLSKLLELRLHVAKLESLGDIICNFGSLEFLDISGCGKIEELVPYGNSQLSNLQLPPNLKKLIAIDCDTMLRLPNLSNLKDLEKLDIGSYSSLREIQGLDELSYIRELKLRGCRLIERLPNMSNLKHLEKLDLRRCSSLIEIEGLEELICIRELLLEGCRSLKRLPNLSNFKHLEELSLADCRSLIEIEGLEELTLIKELDLKGCESVLRLPNLSNLKQLERLSLTYCSSLLEIEGLEELILITGLNLEGCKSMKRLPNLSNLKHLETLDLRNCSSLREIEGLEELTSIRYLHMSDCISMKRLPNLSNIKLMKSLSLTDCSSLREIEGFGELIFIKELNLKGCESILRLPDISNLKQVKRLILTNCSSLIEINGLEELILIRDLVLDGCTSMKRIPNISNLKRLKSLQLRDCSSLREIEGLEGLTSITQLDLIGCDSTMVANTLTLSLFQMYSEFGNRIKIHVDKGDSPNWMSHVSLGCTQVRTNISLSHKLLGLLLSLDCLCQDLDEGELNVIHVYKYTINDRTTPPILSKGTVMVIVPRKKYDIFQVTASCGCHEKEENFKIGVHPLYKLPQTSHASTSTSTSTPTKRKRVME